MRGQATMLNLIGSIPNVEKLLAVRQAYLHLYGKAARPGRKLGHVTVRSDDSGELAAGVAAIADIITPSGDPAPDAD